MVDIRLSEAAQEDLIGIWLSTQDRWGEAQADSYLDDLDRALRALAEFPRKGADYSPVMPGMRRLLVGKHAAFYRIKDDHIRIVRVLHQSMDSAAHLNDV